MYNDYKSLIDNGIEVFSVKTDAFTIQQSKQVLIFILKLADGEFLKLRVLISQLIYIRISLTMKLKSTFQHLTESN